MGCEQATVSEAVRVGAGTILQESAPAIFSHFPSPLPSFFFLPFSSFPRENWNWCASLAERRGGLRVDSYPPSPFPFLLFSSQRRESKIRDGRTT